MLDEALTYPQRDGGWRTVLTGGLLTIFGFLIVPAFIVYGYTVRVLRSAALGEEAAPRFEDWGGLIVDGLKATGIGIVYILVPYVVLFVAIFATVFAAGEESGIGAAVTVLLGVISLVAFVFLFVVAYVLPVALTNFALEDRLGAAFEFRKIATAAFTRDYVVAILLSMGVGFVVSFAFFIVTFIVTFVFQLVFVAFIFGGGDPNIATGAGLLGGIVGLLVFVVLFAAVAVVGFYVQVITYYLLGQGSGATLVDDSTTQSDTAHSETDPQ